MGNLGNFNANDQGEMRDGFDPIPVGKYLAVISASSYGPNSKGTGQVLKLTFQVVEGDYANRLIFVNLNLVNSNAEAEKIAKIELAAICRAVGVITPKDSSELHDKPLVIKVMIEPAKNGYEAKNIIKGYEAMGASPSVPKADEKPPVPSWKR